MLFHIPYMVMYDECECNAHTSPLVEWCDGRQSPLLLCPPFVIGQFRAGGRRSCGTFKKSISVKRAFYIKFRSIQSPHCQLFNDQISTIL